MIGKQITLKLGAVATAHVAFQFVDRRRLPSAHDVKRNGLIGVAAQGFDLKVVVAGVKRVTRRRGGLGRP